MQPSVEVPAREKLAGGYVTVVVKADGAVSARGRRSGQKEVEEGLGPSDCCTYCPREGVMLLLREAW